MLRELVEEILHDGKFTSVEIQEKVEAIVAVIKQVAKKLFFEGQIQDLKDFIFNIPNDKNEQIKMEFETNLKGIIENGGEFLDRLRDHIQGKIDILKKEKNIHSLLDLLDYGHLKGFLSMFKFKT